MSGTTSAAQKTYAFGSMTIAVRTGGVLKWVLADHLGSTSVTANADGSLNSEIRYSAFGEVRYSSGITPTDYQYTNQLNQPVIGLYYYVARFYDPVIAHFVQADTIVPNAGSSSAYDRYAYVLNNPIRWNDPSGHCSDDPTIPCPLRPGERAPFQSASNPVKYSIKYIYPTSTSGNNASKSLNIFIGAALDYAEGIIKNVTEIKGMNSNLTITIPYMSNLATKGTPISSSIQVSTLTLMKVAKVIPFIGYLLQVAPAQNENIQKWGGIENVPPNETFADILVDTTIYCGGQIAGRGSAAGITGVTGNPWVGLGVSVPIGVGATLGIEQVAETNHWRENISKNYENNMIGTSPNNQTPLYPIYFPEYQPSVGP